MSLSCFLTPQEIRSKTETINRLVHISEVFRFADIFTQSHNSHLKSRQKANNKENYSNLPAITCYYLLLPVALPVNVILP